PFLDQGSSTPGLLAGTLAHASEQAEHTGWFGDTRAFDIRAVPMWLAMGSAATVLAQLKELDGRTRAAALEQMREAGLLEQFLNAFGWKEVKELHDHLGIGFGPIKSVLQPHIVRRGKDSFGPS